MRRRLRFLGAACGLTLLSAVPVQAQLNGNHSLGDFGVQAGTQPQPGFYTALFYFRTDTDTIKDADGNTVGLSPDSPGSVDVTAAAPLLWYVSKAKILGANYGVMAVLPWANASLEAPAFALSNTIDTRLHRHSPPAARPGMAHQRARTSPPGSSSIFRQGDTSAVARTTSGRACGHTSPSSGRRSILMDARTTSLATTAFWEFHGDKEDTNVKVGQILTLEGGLGKSFLGGGLVIGGAYYAQWKLTKDQLAEFVLPGGDPIAVDFPNKHKVFALGPDVTLPIASQSKLFALVNIRYFWEMGARVKTEGQTLVVTATFPVPSVRLN